MSWQQIQNLKMYSVGKHHTCFSQICNLWFMLFPFNPLNNPTKVMMIPLLWKKKSVQKVKCGSKSHSQEVASP